MLNTQPKTRQKAVMNRRDFFEAVSGAVVAASLGFPLTDKQKTLIARYRREYDIHSDRWTHRFDVRADGNVYYVSGFTQDQKLKQSEAEEMLKAIEGFVGNKVEVRL